MSPYVPAAEESVHQAFRRYEKAFELLSASGKSFFLVTHGMALPAIANKSCLAARRIMLTNDPDMGDYYIFEITGCLEEGSSSPSKTCRLLTHTFEVRALAIKNDIFIYF